jgi:hypothetical protein
VLASELPAPPITSPRPTPVSIWLAFVIVRLIMVTMSTLLIHEVNYPEPPVTHVMP